MAVIATSVYTVYSFIYIDNCSVPYAYIGSYTYMGQCMHMGQNITISFSIELLIHNLQAMAKCNRKELLDIGD